MQRKRKNGKEGGREEKERGSKIFTFVVLDCQYTHVRRV